MTNREIVKTSKKLYGAGTSPSLITIMAEAVITKGIEWQARPLDSVYPIVYLECILLKIQQDKGVINKVAYLDLGVDIEGRKELLGMWISEKEEAKFLLNVLTELKNRRVSGILIACADDLKVFSEAINTVFSEADIQLCIVHTVWNSMKYAQYDDYKKVDTDL